MPSFTPAPALRAPKDRAPERFPRVPLYTAFVLVGFSIAVTLFGRVTDIGTLRSTVTSPVAMRDVRFIGGSDDVMVVRDAASGDIVETIPIGKDGFIRGALRGIGRERKLRDLSPEEPYRIIRWEDGRLTISDIATGLRVELDPFGPTNSGAFARLLGDRDPLSPSAQTARSPTP